MEDAGLVVWSSSAGKMEGWRLPLQLANRPDGGGGTAEQLRLHKGHSPDFKVSQGSIQIKTSI